MGELGTVLRSMAADVQAPHSADPAALWRHGRQRVRRRLAAVAAIVAVLAVVVGAGTFMAVPVVEVTPAGSPYGAAIPKNVWLAKDWYPGTKDDPPGQVAVVGGITRDGRNGLFVVSARTGAYRLLDLPDFADRAGDASMAALSPDGKHIAYWLTGESSGTPYPDQGNDVSELPVGVGVYDTATGKVARYLPETEHGISTDGLVWLGTDFLALTYGQRTSRTAAHKITTYGWRPFAESPDGRFTEPTAWAGDPLYVDRPMPSTPTAIYREARTGRFGLVGWDGRIDQDSRFTMPGLPGASYQGIGRSRDFAVAAVHRDSGEDSLLFGRTDDIGNVASLEPLGGFGYARLVGWRNDHTVVVLGDGDGSPYAKLYEIDLRTPDSRTTLGTAEAEMAAPGLSFAVDLFEFPMSEGSKPPQIDPRWVWSGVAAGIVVLLALVVPLVRRRRRG